MLEQLETTLFEMRSKIMNNETVNKLLYYDSNDALEQPAVSKDKLEPYITLRSFQNYESKEEYNQNSCINIFPTAIALNDDILNDVIAVNIVINADNWLVYKNHIRVLMLADEVIKQFHNVKFSTALTCQFDSMQDLIINKQLIGYQLLFDLKDGSNQIEF